MCLLYSSYILKGSWQFVPLCFISLRTRSKPPYPNYKPSLIPWIWMEADTSHRKRPLMCRWQLLVQSTWVIEGSQHFRKPFKPKTLRSSKQTLEGKRVEHIRRYPKMFHDSLALKSQNGMVSAGYESWDPLQCVCQRVFEVFPPKVLDAVSAESSSCLSMRPVHTNTLQDVSPTSEGTEYLILWSRMAADTGRR